MSDTSEKTTNGNNLSEAEELERLLNESENSVENTVNNAFGDFGDVIDDDFVDAVDEGFSDISEEDEAKNTAEKDKEDTAEVSEDDIEKVKEAEPDDIKEKQPFNFGREVLEWVESLVFALLIVQLVLIFVFRVVMVDGTSMTNTLQDGDRLIMTHVAYEPERDDVIVLDSKVADKILIKRVIGIEGDKVVVDYNKNHVYVNDEEISNDHIKEIMRDNVIYFDEAYRVADGVYEYNVPDDTVFVMGDNRNDSKDSRSIGFVDESEIMGKAVLRIYPFKSLGLVH
ncbi:signal peptidase I [Ruminococcus sp.]|uniref:signal peptidase I n=1 Tax=Ruminococcus sp. TaxID=41978 RepID=UPI0025910D08|nr:signal peptidase I [Ruminococcus sp.]MCR5019673.1 signal peptidase I [Ruminococcus sp.]